MSKTTATCATSGKLPINDRRSIASSGWPFARTVCNECGNVVNTKADGTFRQHKAIHVASTNAYAREKLAQLQAEHPDLEVPIY